jgi:hypothetical protein
MRAKTLESLESQYKRLLKRAFPLLRFKGITWNWYEVYEHDPHTDPKFLRIQRAFISTAEKRNHPFYNH